MASGCGAANIATHFVVADSGCATPFVSTCLSYFGNTVPGFQARTIYCSSKRIVIQCLRVRMHAGWDWLSCRGALWKAPNRF